MPSERDVAVFKAGIETQERAVAGTAEVIDRAGALLRVDRHAASAVRPCLPQIQSLRRRVATYAAALARLERTIA